MGNGETGTPGIAVTRPVAADTRFETVPVNIRPIPHTVITARAVLNRKLLSVTPMLVQVSSSAI